MENIICAVILAIVAIVCFILGCRQLNEKGFLFNNEYICNERRKTPLILPVESMAGITE